MIRCLDRLLKSLACAPLLLSGLTLTWSSAHAQTLARIFPAAAQQASLIVIQSPDILLNGRAHRLSPGARIRGSNNLLVMPATLSGQSLLVNYLADVQGLIHEVWILNAQEIREARPGTQPDTPLALGSEVAGQRRDDGKTPFNQLPGFPRP